MVDRSHRLVVISALGWLWLPYQATGDKCTRWAREMIYVRSEVRIIFSTWKILTVCTPRNFIFTARSGTSSEKEI